MRCAYLIPTANPPLAAACFAAWQALGWDCYALVDGPNYHADIPGATGVVRREVYPGWGESFNLLARHVAGGYDWLGTGGDDCYPPPVSAETVGRELTAHFSGTFGVAQATGDRWAWDKDGAASPICFAPFVGAEFARRWNGGYGAFWPEYYQWFGDRELYAVTKVAGLLLERPDWHLEHRHVAKTGGRSPDYKLEKHPHWPGDHDCYFVRKAAGFPGAVALPDCVAD